MQCCEKRRPPPNEAADHTEQEAARARQRLARAAGVRDDGGGTTQNTQRGLPAGSEPAGWEGAPGCAATGDTARVTEQLWDELDDQEIADRLARLDRERAFLASRLLKGDATASDVIARHASLPAAALSSRARPFVRAKSDPAVTRWHGRKPSAARRNNSCLSAAVADRPASLSVPRRLSLADLPCGTVEVRLGDAVEALVNLRLDFLEATTAAKSAGGKADGASTTSLTSVRSKKIPWAGSEGQSAIVEFLAGLKRMVDHFVSRSVAYEDVNAAAFVQRELPLLYAGIDIIAWLSRFPPAAKRSRKDVRRIVKTILEVLTTVTYVRAVEGDSVDVWQLDDMSDLLVCFRQIYAFVKSFSGSSWPRRILLARKYAKQLREVSSDMERVWSELGSKLNIMEKPVGAMLDDICHLPQPATHILHRREFRLIWAKYPRWGVCGPPLRGFRHALVELCHDDEAAMAAIYDSHFFSEFAGFGVGDDLQGYVSVETVNARFPFSTSNVSVADVILFHRYRSVFMQNQWMLRCLSVASRLALETRSTLLRKWSGFVTDALRITCRSRLTKHFSVLYRLSAVTAVDWSEAFEREDDQLREKQEIAYEEFRSDGRNSNRLPNAANEDDGSFSWKRVHVSLMDMANSTVCSRLFVNEITWQIAGLIAGSDGGGPNNPASTAGHDLRQLQQRSKLDRGTAYAAKKILLAMASLADNTAKGDPEGVNVPPSPAESNIYNAVPDGIADHDNFEIQPLSSSRVDVSADTNTAKDSESMRDRGVLSRLLLALGSPQSRNSWGKRYFACMSLVVLLLPENALELSSQQIPDVVTFPEARPFDFSRSSSLGVDRIVADWCVDAGVLSVLADALCNADTPLPLLAAAVDVIYLLTCGPSDPVATWRVLRRGEEESAGAPLAGLLESIGSRVSELGRYDSSALWRFSQVCAALNAVARVCSEDKQQRQTHQQRTPRRSNQALRPRRAGSVGVIAKSFSASTEAQQSGPLSESASLPSCNLSGSAHTLGSRSSIAFATDTVLVPSSSLLPARARRISVISSHDGRTSSIVYEPGPAAFGTNPLLFAEQATYAMVPDVGARRLGAGIGSDEASALLSIPKRVGETHSLSTISDSDGERDDDEGSPDVGSPMSPDDSECVPEHSSSTARDSRRAGRFFRNTEGRQVPGVPHAGKEDAPDCGEDCTTRSREDAFVDTLETLQRRSKEVFDEDLAGAIPTREDNDQETVVDASSPAAGGDASCSYGEGNQSGSDFTLVDAANGKEVVSGVTQSQEASTTNLDGCRPGFRSPQEHLSPQSLTPPTGALLTDVDRLRSSDDPADAKAQFELAERCAARSLPGGRDFAEAVRLYDRAARAGHPAARNSLAVCYELGWGVERDIDKAIKLYREGAENGDKAAQRYLGDCYKNGKGVKRDMATAMEWYAQAGDAGSAFQFAA